MLHRHLSHVKLVSAPERPTTAKAYIGVAAAAADPDRRGEPG